MPPHRRLDPKGAKLRFTRLSETFTFEEYRSLWGENMIPMFALAPDGKLFVFTHAADIPLGRVRKSVHW